MTGTRFRGIATSTRAALLSLAAVAIAACSNSNGAQTTVTLVAPDSGYGCDSQILSRCVLPDGTCSEISGPTGPEEEEDQNSICSYVGGVFAFGQACSRTGVQGSCLSGDGVYPANGTSCTFYQTIWLPSAWDSGVPGNPCFGIDGGTFQPATRDGG